MGYKGNQTVAIIGAGPAGCMCAYYASKHADVTLFDVSSPLHTLLYTGGGRCNLAYAEYDFKELVKFYPRGEKFLYSVFSRFGTSEATEFFKEIGVDTYTQEDLRIFPTSNSAKDVREKFLKSLQNCKIIKEKVLGVSYYSSLAEGAKSLIQEEIENFKFQVQTNNYTYKFDKVVIAIGGHAGFSLAENLGHTIVSPKPALTGLISSESFKSLQGVSLKEVEAQIFYLDKKFAPSFDLRGDLLFTHEGISGPLAYKISSICAREDYSRKKPLNVKLNLSPFVSQLILQDILNNNSKKDIKNLVSEFVPRAVAEYILNLNKIKLDEKCCNINGLTRDVILKSLQEFNITVTGHAKEGEVVTSGGVSLNEIDAKTMQSKLVNGLYFCGEVIDVDGFCGGFNLQNCWSTGFIAGECQ